MKRIEKLNPNQVFVFGSNAPGHHAGGAARQALEKFGARWGQAKGLQGQSYGIVTLDENMRKVSLHYIRLQLVQLAEFAANNPEKEFLLTAIGCGIAGFKVEEMREEVQKVWFPDNVVLPEDFSYER